MAIKNIRRKLGPKSGNSWDTKWQFSVHPKNGDQIPPPNRRWDPESVASERSWDGSFLRITLCFQNWLKYVKIQGILEHPLFWWQETWQFFDFFSVTAPDLQVSACLAPLTTKELPMASMASHIQRIRQRRLEPIHSIFELSDVSAHQEEPNHLAAGLGTSQIWASKKNKRVCLVI